MSRVVERVGESGLMLLFCAVYTLRLPVAPSKSTHTEKGTSEAIKKAGIPVATLAFMPLTFKPTWLSLGS